MSFLSGRAVTVATVAGLTVLTVAGAFVVLNCLLAILFELQGFGVPDSAPRPGRLVLLGTGAGLGVAVPAVAAWRLAPGRSCVVGPALGIVGFAVVLAMVWVLF